MQGCDSSYPCAKRETTDKCGGPAIEACTHYYHNLLEERTLSIDEETGEYARLRNSIPVRTAPRLAEKGVNIRKRSLSSGVAFTTGVQHVAGNRVLCQQTTWRDSRSLHHRQSAVSFSNCPSQTSGTHRSPWVASHSPVLMASPRWRASGRLTHSERVRGFAQGLRILPVKRAIRDV